MEGAVILHSTYWIRFAHGQTTFDHAVENTRTLFEAPVGAGIQRVIHFSVANSSTGLDLPYFRGKAQVEKMLKGLGVPYAIIRPTLVFGDGDLLLNNMAWALRRFPVFPVCGNGDYPVQPVYAEDLCGPGGGGRFSERELHRRRSRAGHVLLRCPASPAGLRNGRPRAVGSHAPVGGPRPDPAGRPADARCGARPRGG